VEIHNWTVLVNDNNPKSEYEWGMTFGPYINSQNMRYNDDMYHHELGHTIQSRIIGPFYLTKVAIPSGISELFGSEQYHSQSWYEVWASRLGGAPNRPPEYYLDFRHNDFWYWLKIITLRLYAH